MSTLDDFFGSSEEAVIECLYCGGTDGELVIAIRNNDGPTHWRHEACRQAHEAGKVASFAGDPSEWASREGRDGAE